jgi:hypothetical protein
MSEKMKTADKTELKEEELEKVEGGFNPQPEPPGRTLINSNEALTTPTPTISRTIRKI